MTSHKKIAANRANSHKSTGPKTSLGKRHASLNAISHTGFSMTHVLPSEDPAAYDALQKAILKELHPNGVIEGSFVDSMVLGIWRLNRLNHAEHSHLKRKVETYSTRRQHSSEIATLEREHASAPLSPLPIHEQITQFIKDAKDVAPNSDDLEQALEDSVTDLNTAQISLTVERLRRSIIRGITQDRMALLILQNHRHNASNLIVESEQGKTASA